MDKQVLVALLNDMGWKLDDILKQYMIGEYSKDTCNKLDEAIVKICEVAWEVQFSND